MSSAVDSRVHSRAVVQLKDKATLIIPESVMLKIHYLHHRVTRGTEWSGILVYNVVSGDIKVPAELVLQVKDIILMDVGTSGYTEYDIDSSDTYAFDKWTEALVSGDKLGHIHTHHNMGCFFSGVDTSELHDNAPNHNYYLSLIVNYKEIDSWVAKIAICGEIKQEGHKITKGVIKTISSFLGTTGAETVETEETLDSEEDINNSQQVLYTIDCELKVDDSATDFIAFQQRVTEKEAAKPLGYRSTYASSTAGYSHTGSTGNVSTPPSQSGASSQGSKVKETTTGGSQVKMALDLGGEDNEAFETTTGVMGYPKDCLSPGKIRSLLIKILALDDEVSSELGSVVFKLQNSDPSDQELALNLMDDFMEKRVAAFLNIKSANYEIMHGFAVSAMDLLRPYKHLTVYDKLLGLFEVYILPFNFMSSEETEHLTGLKSKDYVDLISVM